MVKSKKPGPCSNCLQNSWELVPSDTGALLHKFGGEGEPLALDLWVCQSCGISLLVTQGIGLTPKE